MIVIYSYLDYRSYLRDWLKQQKAADKDVTFAKLAAAIGMQGPAFSKVINGDVNFSRDQQFLLSQELHLEGDERLYFELMIEHQCSALKLRQEVILNQLLALQKKHISTPKAVDSAEFNFTFDQDRAAYFSSPWAPIVHVYLTIPRYQADPGRIAQELCLPKVELFRLLQLLQRMNLVRSVGPQIWAATEASVHSQDLSGLPAAQQLLIRSVMAHRLSVLPLDERYGLSVAFSTDKSTYEQSRQILVKAIQEIHKLVGESASEDVYYLSLDLFPVSS